MTNDAQDPQTSPADSDSKNPAAPADRSPLPPEIELRREPRPSLAELMDLYGSVGWSAYTDYPKVLEKAVANSRHVVTAWHEGRLVGLARIVGDDASIAYLQDVLVRPEYRRYGVGRRLVIEVFAPYADVRQHVLITDEAEGQKEFYESLGFTLAREIKPIPVNTFVRFSSGRRRAEP